MESDGYIYVVKTEGYDTSLDNTYLVIDNYNGCVFENYEVPFESGSYKLKPVNCSGKISFTAYPLDNKEFSLTGKITNDDTGEKVNFTIPESIKEFDKTFTITGTDIPGGSYIQFDTVSGMAINTIKHKNKKCYVDNNSFVVNVNTPKTAYDNISFTATYYEGYLCTEDHSTANNVTQVIAPKTLEATATSFEVTVNGRDTYVVIAEIGNKTYIATGDDNVYTFSDVVINADVKITISSKVYVSATFVNDNNLLKLLTKFIEKDASEIYVNGENLSGSNPSLTLSNVSGCVLSNEIRYFSNSKRFVLYIDYITDEIITFTATLKYNTSA